MSKRFNVILFILVALGASVLFWFYLNRYIYKPKASSGSGGVVAVPINSSYETNLPFGTRSHWVQPWRGYLDTWPASRLHNAVGINFNVDPDQAEATAQVLQASGFTRGRIEEGWGNIDYNNPTRLTSYYEDRLRQQLTAMKNHNIRPLILLNSNHGLPAPLLNFNLVLVAPAKTGDRTVQLDAASAAHVVPGKTGFNGLTEYKAAEVIIAAVDGSNVATVSKPLPKDLAAGSYSASTLKFEPFSSPKLADGSANPRFEATMQGWLEYVQAVTTAAKTILGDDEFDIEVWNELQFGSHFLYIGLYYDPAPPDAQTDFSRQLQTRQEILHRSVAWVRDPAHGMTDVGIGNGFSNQEPFAGGSDGPVGLSALDKHLYPGVLTFPTNQAAGSIASLDTFGSKDGHLDSNNNWIDGFTPSYRSYFPEYYLNSIQTENLIRDISPYTENLYGQTDHGRNAAPPGGQPPAVWETEFGLGWTNAAIAPAANQRFTAKSTLRSLVSHISKGVERLYFFGAHNAGDITLISDSFFDQLSQHPGVYPGDGAGGPVLAGVKRLLDAIPEETITRPRSLSLRHIENFSNNAQFAGDGTDKHPPLYNREVTTFFPFQINDHRFVVAAYVMTRDMGHLYYPDKPDSDPARYDLPAELYRFTFDGLNVCPTNLIAIDPLTNETIPVSVVSCQLPTVEIELPLTDSPRLININESGSSVVPTSTQLTPTSNSCRHGLGDANCDGKVDIVDFELWRREFTREVSTTLSDFNGDAKIDIIDFELWRKSFSN